MAMEELDYHAAEILPDWFASFAHFLADVLFQSLPLPGYGFSSAALRTEATLAPADSAEGVLSDLMLQAGSANTTFCETGARTCFQQVGTAEVSQREGEVQEACRARCATSSRPLVSQQGL